MSIKDLLANWEEALGQALSQPSETAIGLPASLADRDLENVAAPHVRSGVRAAFAIPIDTLRGGDCAW